MEMQRRRRGRRMGLKDCAGWDCGPSGGVAGAVGDTLAEGFAAGAVWGACASPAGADYLCIVGERR